MPDGPGFRTYAELGRPFAVWNVFAAPELSLELRRWCFPFAGCVSYRGYFSKTQARAFAAGLAASGDDVDVGGVAAYSTLGWFEDPLLSTFVAYPEPELARLLFHETAHRVAYAADDTVFNESFATAVEQEGVGRWLARHGSEAQRTDFRARERRRGDFLRLVEGTRRRLAALYAAPAPAEVRRAGKAGLLRELRLEYEEQKLAWAGYAGYDSWFGEGLNNARIAAAAAYTDLVPAFQRLLARLGGDLPAFYREAKRLASAPRGERRALLAEDSP